MSAIIKAQTHKRRGDTVENTPEYLNLLLAQLDKGQLEEVELLIHQLLGITQD